MKNEKYEKEEFTKLVLSSNNLSDIAKKMGLNPFCGNRNTIKKYIKLYNIDISHFRIDYSNRINRKKRDLSEILVIDSVFNNTNLKHRLYDERLKERKCEKCGQDENWNGEHMSLILDHINGINNDNRLENLRIVCPNCNATLSTHGGKNVKNSKYKKTLTDNIIKNYCKCGKIIDRKVKKCNICDSYKQRKIKRPPYEQLVNEVKELGYSGTGRKYGVSDNAIRKWIKFYEKHTPS